MRRPPSTVSRLVGRATALVVLVGLSGCSGQTQREAEPLPDPGVTQVQPGAPGEPARELAADARVGTPGWNHDDLAFVQMMVPHHQQALEMAALAQTRASSPDVLGLARRIEAAQGPEIVLMAGWLAEQGVDVPAPGDAPSAWDHAAHGHTGMAGVLTPEQMTELAAADGEDFDRLFLEGMIAHHEGAVEMALDVLSAGRDQRVLELADDVSAGQSAEIVRLQRVLAGL
ncbi:hypothetical protein I601_0200 [Nocardioides dokdonensis FR1436]|uniref:DUF305 domain-containing protein n=1 Tax=Nocardioides dokdonensis FR1436 TaxID=1300347 RepID=A0A1A9GEI9_9ACTN|nr:DUF305 domain-containing protein [Nocardioides dokdonensis]ANH36654.1 hypothetical protein I601_0200 [Nocardioides dokdonensis FR1436]